MIDATTGYDFGEEEVKFVDILVRRANGNKLVDILDIDELRKEMQKEGISPDTLRELCEKMEDNGILQYKSGFSEMWITLNSDQVVRFQAHLKRISCPKCHKRPLRRKVVIYCPDCDYKADAH